MTLRLARGKTSSEFEDLLVAIFNIWIRSGGSRGLTQAAALLVSLTKERTSNTDLRGHRKLSPNPHTKIYDSCLKCEPDQNSAPACGPCVDPSYPA